MHRTREPSFQVPSKLCLRLSIPRDEPTATVAKQGSQIVLEPSPEQQPRPKTLRTRPGSESVGCSVSVALERRIFCPLLQRHVAALRPSGRTRSSAPARRSLSMDSIQWSERLVPEVTRAWPHPKRPELEWAPVLIRAVPFSALAEVV